VYVYMCMCMCMFMWVWLWDEKWYAVHAKDMLWMDDCIY